MKILATLFLIAAPASAFAGEWRRGYPETSMFSGHLLVLLYAALAALGYWVTQHSAKETSACVKRTGAVVGTALVAVGLLGMLCGLFFHVRHCAWRCHAPEQPAMTQPQVPVSAPAMPAPAKAPETRGKKAK